MIINNQQEVKPKILFYVKKKVLAGIRCMYISIACQFNSFFKANAFMFSYLEVVEFTRVYSCFEWRAGKEFT